MTARALRLVIAPALLAALSLPAVARADPTPADQALAAALFDDGRSLLAAGKIDEACAKLGRSYELEAALGTLLNLAVCHDKQGKSASAWAEFNTAADLAAKAKDAARRKFAEEQAKLLGARLSRLIVRAGALPQGAAVKLDGRDLGAALLGTALPLDPGEHRVEVTAPSKRTFASTVKLDPGPAQRILEVPPLADEEGPSPPPPANVPPANPPGQGPKADAGPNPPPAPPPASEVGGRSTPRLAAGIAVGAAGLVGVVIGSVAGVRTFQAKGKIGNHCDESGNCDAVGVTHQDEAHTNATVSTVAFAVGLTAVAGGVVLIATSGRSRPKTTAWVAPAPGGFAAGIRF